MKPKSIPYLSLYKLRHFQQINLSLQCKSIITRMITKTDLMEFLIVLCGLRLLMTKTCSFHFVEIYQTKFKHIDFKRPTKSVIRL